MRCSDHDHRLRARTIEAGYGMRMHDEAPEGSADALAARRDAAAPNDRAGRSGGWGERA
jgi:hypothetical protein